MATIIIPRRHLIQPQGRVELADEFSASTMAFCGTALDVARKRQIALTAARVGPLGQYSSNGGAGIALGNASEWLPTGAEVTVLFAGKLIANQDFPLLSTDSTASGQAVSIYLPYGLDGKVYWRWGGEVEGASSLSIGGLSFAEHDLWAFTAGPRGMEIWQNGLRVASNLGSSSITTDSPLRYGQFTSLGGVATVSSALLLAVPRQLDMSFLSSRQYFSVFRADPIRFYSLPSGAITLTGLIMGTFTSSGARATVGIAR